MATAAISAYDTNTRGRVIVHFATTITQGDQTAFIRLANYNLKKLAIQAYGTASGSTVSVEGSWDGTNVSSLHDTDGTTIAITAAAIEDIREFSMPYIRANCATSTGAAWTIKFIGQYE